jgi:hypothetical protein
MCLGLLLAGGILSLQASNDVVATIRAGEDGLEVEQRHEVIAYEPVCSDDPLPVCVHPAYERALDALSSDLNRLAAPLIGVPGAPVRAEQLPFTGGLGIPLGGVPGDALVFDLHASTELSDLQPSFWYPFAMQLVQDDYHSFGEARGESVLPQQAVAAWLLNQAGIASDYPLPNSGQAEFGNPLVRAAAERFAAFDPTTRRAWLEEHFAALRAGELTSEDLP